MPTLPQVLLGAAGVAAFVLLLFGLTLVMPGPMHEGAPRADGGRRSYRLNGLPIFVLILAAAAGCQAAGWSLGILARNFWALCLGANLLAFAASAALLLAGRDPARGWLRDYFYGRDRDPSLLGVDLKLFSYRPSLIGLALINLSFAAAQIETTGQLTLAMAAYQAMTLLYVANYFQFEHGMLFTWDIIEERFGWMLVWGDYVLVPFFYCLPAIFLARPQPPPAPAAVAGLAALYLLGFWLFRGANQQKHDFKRDPATRIWGRPAETIEGRLLVSGFWGIGRKLNYAGELAMYLAWTALAGLASPWPWLLPAWLGILLAHRAWRDEQRCRRKYGALWDAYCRRARFRMIPFVY